MSDLEWRKAASNRREWESWARSLMRNSSGLECRGLIQVPADPNNAIIGCKRISTRISFKIIPSVFQADTVNMKVSGEAFFAFNFRYEYKDPFS